MNAMRCVAELPALPSGIATTSMLLELVAPPANLRTPGAADECMPGRSTPQRMPTQRKQVPQRALPAVQLALVRFTTELALSTTLVDHLHNRVIPRIQVSKVER
jgi:hypothetical protein